MAEVIVALDMPEPKDAIRLLDRIPALRWAKIGPTLFLRAGGELVRTLKDRECQVFLDLKWHDIPHQVSGAVRAARAMGVDLATVHALGGGDMIRSAVDAADGALRIAAVSVLTSQTAESLGQAIGRPVRSVEDEVDRLVDLAVGAGAGAVVCSPLEVGRIRSRVPADCWLVVPGIRMSGDAVGDQARVAGPGEAVAEGATHLVVGRPVWRSEKPEAVYQRICELST